MALPMCPNHNAEDTEPGVGKFKGYWVLLLFAATLIFVLIWRFCSEIGMDMISSGLLSGSPFVVALAYVQFFVNGKPPSYARDLLLWKIFKLREKAFLNGWTDAPPNLWTFKKSKRP